MTTIEQAAQALRELVALQAIKDKYAHARPDSPRHPQWKQYLADVEGFFERQIVAWESARAVLASLEAAKQEPLTGWQPIETAPNERALLFSPPEALWEDPTGKAGEMRVARPAEWTWARFWMPLPAAPSPGSGT